MIVTATRACFFVPSGYVCILREVIVLLSPLETIDDVADGFLDIVINGGVVDPPDVEVGPGQGLTVLSQSQIAFRDGVPTPTFVIADEGASVGVTLDVPDDLPIQSANLRIGFRGQFLLKTGVPAQFQAANEAGRARHAVTSGTNDLALSDSDSVMVRRRKKIPFPNVPILRK